jgi:uncharacterized protein involved in cysteine biosynthesis
VRRVRANEAEHQRIQRVREATVRHAHQAQQAAAQRVDLERAAAAAGRFSRAAATQTDRAARVAVSGIVAFGVGLGAFWRGLWAFLRSPMLWLYAALPAAIVYTLTLLSDVGVHAAIAGAVDWATGFADDWPSVIRTPMHLMVAWGLGAVASAVLGLLTVPLTLLVGAPFYVLIVRRLERRLGDDRTGTRPSWPRAVGFVLWQTILVTLIVTFGGLLLVPLLLIPGINVVAALFVTLVFNGFLVGLLAVGLPLHHRGVTGFRRHLRHAWRRRASVVAFGAMSVLVLSIPFAPLRWCSIPAVFVGAVLVHRRFPYQPEYEITRAPQPLPPQLSR